jgi:hypothetical protein
MFPPQKWCGQTQPHNPHTWVEPSDRIGLYISCAGHSGVIEENKQAFEREMYDTSLTVTKLPEEVGRRRRLRSCVEEWPECYEGGYNPKCCRFPKSCSCTAYPDNTPPEELEEVATITKE